METLLWILLAGVLVGLFVFERLFPGRDQPRTRWWLAKGIGCLVVGGTASAVPPLLVGMAVEGHTLLDISALGIVFGALVYVVVGDLIRYWLHRAAHKYDFLWRWVHQMHHSAERMDIIGFFFTHPFESMANGVVSALLPILLGGEPLAASLGGFIVFCYSLFTHTNMKTPHWLGYILQRPESHSIHHAQGIHAFNYGGIPLCDLLFGTFRNPRRFSELPYGFYHGASDRVREMLIGRDISGGPAEPPALTQERDSPAAK